MLETRSRRPFGAPGKGSPAVLRDPCAAYRTYHGQFQQPHQNRNFLLCSEPGLRALTRAAPR